MKRKFAYAFVTAMMAGGMTIGAAGGASAAHCVDPETGTSPGFSYFGNDHVQEKDHNGAEPGQPEGGKVGPHAGTSGASNCLETSGNPSKRAPGRAS